MFNFFNPYTVWLGIAHIPLFLISLYCAILSYHLVTDQFPCTVLHCFSCGDYADIDIEPPLFSTHYKRHFPSDESFRPA